MKKKSRNNNSFFTIIIIILVVITFISRFWRLESPNSPVFDEVYYPKWASEFLQGATPYDVHPPLVKLFIALGEKIFSNTIWSTRFFSALLGSLIVFLTYLLANKLFKNKIISVIAAILVAFDGLFFVLSRTAIMEIYVTFFLVLSILSFLIFLEAKKNQILWLFLTGLSLGMAISCKWTNFAVWGFIIFWIILYWKDISKKFIGNFLFYFICFIMIVPVIVYSSSLVVWYHGVHNFIKDIIPWHKNAFNFHKGLTSPHPYSSEWWSWPLLIRPVWFYFQKVDDLVYGIIAVGNPFIWWPALITLFWSVWNYLKTKNKMILFCLLGFAFNYFPWIMIERIKFNYYFLPALFFEILILAYFLGTNWSKHKKYILIYLALVIITFLFYYSIMADWPMTNEFHKMHLWFRNWI